ncbi:hypothetical protein [Bythopirellula goksoeyrii]|uniref:hypothetical protein n=1 Tax=Bythopirellula goksoeyrii TaxID=1400387 RepID=UPI00143CE43D|nr:hypothetical protein [Bythopirellula goksoeyrii]
MSCGSALADTFYYTGPSGGDFFNESFWNSMANGSGFTPAVGTINPGLGISHYLILDGDVVEANGGAGDEFGVDIGNGGGLELQTGSSLNVFNDFFNAQFEISTGATFKLTDADLTVQDDIVFRDSTTLTGGSIESFFDDIEFRSSNLIINGTNVRTTDVSSGSTSNIWVQAELTPSAGASITGATFFSNSRFGIDQFDMVAHDSVFMIDGDLEDLTTTDIDSATASLTLTGNSSITAGQIQEGVKLILNDSSTATFTNIPGTQVVTHTWFTNSSNVTINSPDVELILANPQLETGAGKVINGITGLSYADDASTWDPTTWNGTDAVTLKITSVPSAADPDFDGDGDVDGNDFLVWQRGFGLTNQSDNSNGDSNGDGTVDGIDLGQWQSEYGNPSNIVSVTAVPEPATIVVAMISLGSLICNRRRFGFEFSHTL